MFTKPTKEKPASFMEKRESFILDLYESIWLMDKEMGYLNNRMSSTTESAFNKKINGWDTVKKGAEILYKMYIEEV